MSSRITGLLHRLRDGEPDALDELMPLVYSELRRIAGAVKQAQRPGHTLQPTALVNEAFIKLFDDGLPEFSDRAHFLALMSRVMRQVLVDHARAARAAKRGGDARVPWDTQIEVAAQGGPGERLELLDLHDAMDALARDSPSLAHAIEMHYFGGMTADEIAAVANRSVHIVRHDIRLARAWLRRELSR